MKRFHFRLQALATLRDLEERRALAALVEARQAFQQAVRRLQEKEQNLHQMAEFVVQQRTHVFHAQEQADDLAALSAENRSVQTCREDARRWETRQGQLQTQWLAAHRQSKLLDELRSRARQLFLLEYRQLEQKEVEELAYLRRRQETSL